MPETTTFGTWIRSRRKTLDLTQQKLARRINCSLSTIVKIESDQRRPSTQIAILLAQQLGIPENRMDLFLKVARGIRPIDAIEQIFTQPEQLFQLTGEKQICVLPVLPTPMVGRKSELTEIVHLLNRQECRLLTIIGLGGVGKTRLAIEAAQKLTVTEPSLFPDGICFVSLTSVIRVENIPKAIAGAINFELSGPMAPEEQLLNFLESRVLLLLLDNVEHLLNGTGMINRILERAPGVKLLVTSRERLNLRSEWVFYLQGLPVPPLDAEETLEQFSATKLFLNLVRQAQIDFTLQNEDRPVLTRICQLLDGIPLAIELAASWARTLSMNDIAEEIAQDLDFLTTSARDFPERHRSLRVVFDNSWSLLSPNEQRVLRQLSIFRGGFSREAAQMVTRADLPVLNSLIGKSLLRRSETTRYDLHELIRGYAAEHLAQEPGEDTAVQKRHSEFFLSLVRDLENDLHSSQQKAAVAKLSPEIVNIRLACEWAVEHGEIETLDEASNSLLYFLELRNYYREAESIFRRAAEATQIRLKGKDAQKGEADREKYASARGKFLMQQSLFAMRLGEVSEIEDFFIESISLLRSVQDPISLAYALTYYARLNWTKGKLDLAQELVQESIQLIDAHGPAWQAAFFRAVSGNIAYDRGEYEHSYVLLQDSLKRSQSIGDPRLIGFVTAYLGRTAMKLDRYAEIEGSLWDGARITQESGDRFGYGLILGQLAQAAKAKEDLILADQFFDASLELLREIGDTWNLSRALVSWGEFKQSTGELSKATAHFKEAIHLSLDSQSLLIALNALVGLAEVFAQEGQLETALEIAIRVLNHPASSHEAKTKAIRIHQELEIQLTSEAVEVVHQRLLSEPLDAFIQNTIC